MIKIIPAVMPDDFNDLKEKIEKVEDLVDEIQIDVMDGKFVPAFSWPYGKRREHFEDIQQQNEGLPGWDKLNFEIDLMVRNPKEEAIRWIDAGATRLIFHLDSFKGDETEFLRDLKGKYNIEIGVSITPEIPNTELDKYLDLSDVVQFMGIDEVGFQGQKFNKDVLDKIKELREKSDIEISVDGGVSFDTAPKLIEAGATRLVSGSVLFENPKESLKKFGGLVG
ncbi:MAG: ribulose-phosphate 3-epimerase [Candidatus Paceibacteria bacterium]|jgi:ribulose-phosphate 3-epimerase